MEHSIEKKAYSVDEFCAAYGICKTHFYKLIKANKGPKTTKIGRRTLISMQAAERWFESHSA